MLKQGKNEKNFSEVLEYLANEKELPEQYRNYTLFDSKKYLKCCECHIELDWLLVYKIK